MPDYTTADIRNILIAAMGRRETTLIDAMLLPARR